MPTVRRDRRAANNGSVNRYIIVGIATVAVAAIGVAVVLYTPWSSESASVSRGVYVVSATTGGVVKIDPETRQVTETIELDAAYLSTIDVAGEYLYYASWDGTSRSSIGRYNLATDENEPAFIVEEFYAALLRSSPAQPGVLFVGEQGLSPANIQKWSVPSDGEVPTLLARTEHGPMGSNLQDFEISDDGAKIWSACGAPYEFLELNTSDLRLSGRIYPAEAYPNAVDAVDTGDTEYLLGGSDSLDASIHFYDTKDPRSEAHYAAAERTDVAGSVVLSPDASKIYRVVPAEDRVSAVIETLAADTGDVLATAPVRLSEYVADGIQTDPASGTVFVSLADGVGVLDPEGTALETIPVAGAGQIVIT